MKDIEDDFIEWIQYENQDIIESVLLDENDLPGAMKENMSWMRFARGNKVRITDPEVTKSGSPLGLIYAKIIRVKFEWDGLVYDIKWTSQIESAVKEWSRNRKIDEILNNIR